MRIAYKVSEFPALSQTFILKQITGMIDRGHEVDIFTDRRPTKGSIMHDDVQSYGLLVRTFAPDMPKRLVPRALKALGLLQHLLRNGQMAPLTSLNIMRYGRAAASLRMLHELTPFAGRPAYDIVHANFGPNGLKALKLRDAGILQGRLLTTFHGYDVSSYLLQHGRFVYAPLFEAGDLFIAISRLMTRRLVDLGCPKERLVCLPLGIDLSEFAFKPRVVRADEPVRLLSVGRLIEKKGYDTAINAFALIAQNYPGVEYNIVGGGPLHDSLKGLIGSLGLEHRVHLLGAMTENQVRAQYDRSHLFLLASQTALNGDEEGLPQVVKEAQAMGLPIVATRHSAIPEAVTDGESGFLVDERNPEALANRIAFLLRNPHSWPRFGAAGRALVEERFDNRKLIDQLVDVYKAVSGQKTTDSTAFRSQANLTV